MPSYVLNPLLDEVFFEDVLCKKFLSLDLREPPKSLLSVMPIGHKKVETPWPLSLGGTSLTDSRDSAPMTSSHWGQHFEQPCPPLSRWNKMSFWAERSVSMVEAGSDGLRWPCGEDGSSDGHCKLPSALSPAISAAGSSSSSRYKTELCRTFAESGACKYGGKCQFAHGEEELRDLSRHPKYKTEPCRTFHTIGYCPYGIRCHFVHNNEDDLGPAARCPPPGRAASRRPPLLRQSVSFAGFPSGPPPPEPSPLHAFLRAPSSSSLSPPEPSPLHAFLRAPSSSSSSPPALADVPELLSPAPRFQASHESARPLCCHAPPRPVDEQGCRRRQQASMLGSFALGSRSRSYTSLSDHEGGSGSGSASSSSSLSGSESSVFDGASRRLPIFSQLSVPDDGLGNGGSTFFI